MASAIPEDRRDKPRCPCCNGSGMHHYYAVAVGAPSPDDDDAECSLCAGTGESWFAARPRSCSGYRTLNRVARRY